MDNIKLGETVAHKAGGQKMVPIKINDDGTVTCSYLHQGKRIVEIFEAVELEKAEPRAVGVSSTAPLTGRTKRV